MEKTQIEGKIITKVHSRIALPEYGGRIRHYEGDPDSWYIGRAILHAQIDLNPALKNSKEGLSIEFYTPKVSGLLLSWSSKSVFLKARTQDSEFWMQGSSNKPDTIHEGFIKQDADSIFFVGFYSITTSESLADISIEKYSFTAIFDRDKGNEFIQGYQK